MIRTDFVSNSSSSSFVIVGGYVDKNDCIEILKHYCKEDELKKIIENDEIKDTIYDKDIFHENGLEYCRCDGYDCDFIVGICPQEMKDDQTLAQFKKDIYEKMTNLGIKISPNKVEFHTGVNSDGEFVED